MIIFGTRAKTIEGFLMNGMSCDHCGNNEQYSYGILRYFHIFWVPILMYRRNAGIICTHCKSNLYGSDLDSSVRNEIISNVIPVQVFWKYFIGLAIIAVFLIYTSI